MVQSRERFEMQQLSGIQAIELRFVRKIIVRAIPQGMTGSYYGTEIYRAPAGLWAFLETVTMNSLNIAANRTCWLADGRTDDALTEGIVLNNGTAGVPVGSQMSPPDPRGSYFSTGVLYFGTFNAQVQEIIQVRAQVGLYMPNSQVVAPESFDTQKEPEPIEGFPLN